jgi:beta-glucosidase
VSPLEGIQTQAAAHGDRVVYTDGSSQADAVAAANAADVAIVFVGDTASEGSDRQDLNMHPGVCATLFCSSAPFDQEATITAVAGANPKTVVVIDAGAPVAMPWLKDVKSVVDAFYPGTENGNAIAAVLYGEANPSGKLPQTFPKALGDMPARTKEQYPGVDGKAAYSEGLKVGYRWFDSQGIEPLFPFGFGLSYTSFDYAGLGVTPDDDGATVRFTVRNTGRRSGAEVGQVYVGFPAALGEPPLQLKGFQKVDLEDGAARSVEVKLDRRAFSYWSSDRKDWVRARGCYTIAVGGSSRDLPLRTVVPIGGAHCAPKPARRCVSRRSILVHLRGVRGKRVRSVAIYVNGKRQRVQRSRSKRVRVRLTGRPRTTARIQLVITTTRGRPVLDRRTYRTCRTRRESGK